ncbi:MAG TPA: ECF-type sigma factor [Candidatus Acidoferrum sp.]|nr:ECF-type sigma factor [Candidatus Acidoferrum sp.]
MGGQGARAPNDLAVVVEAVTAEERRSLDDLYSAAYEQLRRLAASVRRGSPALTLSPTTLVNEAWAKLAASPGVASTSLPHFKRIAARAMRQVLVEAARRKYAGKRGGRQALFVTLDESVAQAGTTPSEIVALDAALEELARLQPRQAQMVEYRFFGGLDITETAELLHVSEATIQRDWRAVKAWLARALRQAS